VSSTNQQATFLGEVMRAVCEMMCSFGIPRTVAAKQIQQALKMGYASRDQRMSQQFRPITNMADLCGRWHFEKAYVDKKGNPKPLTWNGKTGSLLRFAQRVNGKARAKSVVADLISRKMLKRTRDGGWIPKAQVVKPAGLDSAQRLRSATMMQRLLQTIAHNSKRKYRGDDLMFEVMVSVPRLPTRNRHEFRRFARAQGMVFATNVNDWLESRNVELARQNGTRTKEAGVVAFLFEQPPRSR